MLSSRQTRRLPGTNRKKVNSTAFPDNVLLNLSSNKQEQGGGDRGTTNVKRVAFGRKNKSKQKAIHTSPVTVEVAAPR